MTQLLCKRIPNNSCRYVALQNPKIYMEPQKTPIANTILRTAEFLLHRAPSSLCLWQCLPSSLPLSLYISHCISWYLFVTSFMCVKTFVFNIMNGDTILEHVLLLPGTKARTGVCIWTAPFSIVNISTSTFEDQTLGMWSLKPVGSYADL